MQPKLVSVVSTRVDEEVFDEIAACAAREGRTVADVARRALQKRFKPVVKPPREREPRQLEAQRRMAGAR